MPLNTTGSKILKVITFNFQDHYGKTHCHKERPFSLQEKRTSKLYRVTQPLPITFFCSQVLPTRCNQPIENLNVLTGEV